MESGSNAQEIHAKKEEKEPISLPEGFGSAFAQGLTNGIGSSLTQLDTLTSQLSEGPLTNIAREAILTGNSEIRRHLTHFALAETVRVVPYPSGEGFEFAYEKVAKNPIQPKPGTIRLPAGDMTKFIAALQHTFFNPFALANGYSELLATRETGETKATAETMMEESKKVKAFFSNMNRAHEIETRTDKEGNTTIQCIYKPEAQ